MPTGDGRRSGAKSARGGRSSRREPGRRAAPRPPEDGGSDPKVDVGDEPKPRRARSGTKGKTEAGDTRSRSRRRASAPVALGACPLCGSDVSSRRSRSDAAAGSRAASSRSGRRSPARRSASARPRPCSNKGGARCSAASDRRPATASRRDSSWMAARSASSSTAAIGAGRRAAPTLCDRDSPARRVSSGRAGWRGRRWPGRRHAKGWPAGRTMRRPHRATATADPGGRRRSRARASVPSWSSCSGVKRTGTSGKDVIIGRTETRATAGCPPTARETSRSRMQGPSRTRGVSSISPVGGTGCEGVCGVDDERFARGDPIHRQERAPRGRRVPSRPT